MSTLILFIMDHTYVYWYEISHSAEFKKFLLPYFTYSCLTDTDFKTKERLGNTTRWDSKYSSKRIKVYAKDSKDKYFTGKSLSEALIFASINPQYDNRLFMELP